MLNPERKYSAMETPPQDYEPEKVEWETLTDLADLFKTDKGTIKHNYTQIYEKYIRRDVKSLMEIGVACGSSLKMWSTYLPEANITGVDIRQECESLCKDYPNVKIIIADACKLIPDKVFDVIIDDGSHVSLDIVQTFRNLWKNVKSGGFYVIEDFRCTHDPQYIDLFGPSKSTQAFDRKHVMSWMDGQMRLMDYGISDIEYIHYYRELMVIKKK